jgi:Icc-related predicted phosphoesterase
MKIDISSDLQLDHWKSSEITKVIDLFEGGDLLLLAGDLGSQAYEGFLNTRNFLEKVSQKYDYVVHTLGNHDFYNPYIVEPKEDFSYLPSSDYVKCINRDIFRFKGVTIAACFAWYETGPELNDVNFIKDAISFSRDQKKKDFEFLEGLVGQQVDILMTHCPLSAKTIDPRFSGDPLNKYYHHDREDLIKRINPKLYVSGHIHNQTTYSVGNTICVSHPMGYKKELSPYYKPYTHYI